MILQRSARILPTVAGLLLATFGTSAAQAQPANQAESGGTHIMPLCTEDPCPKPTTTGQQIEAPAPGIPIGEEALRKIKRRKLPPGQEDPTDETPPPAD